MPQYEDADAVFADFIHPGGLQGKAKIFKFGLILYASKAAGMVDGRS